MAGIFSGYNADTGRYDPISWQLEGVEYEAPAAGMRDHWESELRDQSGQSDEGRQREHHAAMASDTGGGAGDAAHATSAPERDETLQHPRCVYQVLKRHYSRYTPEAVSRVCGMGVDEFLQVARTITENSQRDRTTAWVYSVGWTHHSVGAQYIRGAAILQTLLGNMGRPGGGILALRGHASIQGSTDVPTLYDLLPGYIPMPNAHLHDSLRSFLDADAAKTGFWGNMDAYMVSLLKAWWGDAATAENDWAFDYMPRLTGDHGTYGIVRDQIDRKTYGYFVVGENPAVGHANGKMQRLGLANLEWLVVRDMQMIETATFWKDGPEIETEELRTEDIGTEVFFLPCANHTEKAGTFTNTQRLLQWRREAVHPPGDARSELHFYFHLGKKIRREARRVDRRARPAPARPHLGLPDVRGARGARPRVGARRDQRLRRRREPALELHAAQGRRLHHGGLLDLHRRLRGRRQPGRPSQARLRAGLGGRRVGLGVAGEPPHALQPRLGRRRRAGRGASARPTSGGTPSRRRGRGTTSPTSRRPSRRRTSPPRAPRARTPCPAPTRSSCRPTGRRGSTRPPGSPTGRCRRTTSRWSRRWRTCCTSSRTTRPSSASTGPGTGSTPRRARSIPYAFLTYRLTEHHTAGGMSRFLPLPLGAPAGVLLRGLPRAGRGAGPRAPGLGDAHLGTHGDRGPGARDRADETAADRGPGGAPDRAAVPLGVERPLDRRPGQRPARRRAGPERPHPGVQGRHLRHPAGTPSPRARRCSTSSSPTAARPGWSRGVTRDRGLWRRLLRGAATSLSGPLPDPTTDAGWSRPTTRSASASSPTPRCASAARPARWRARSGTCCPMDGTDGLRPLPAHPGCRTTTPATLGATSWRHVAFIEHVRPHGSVDLAHGGPPAACPSTRPPAPADRAAGGDRRRAVDADAARPPRRRHRHGPGETARPLALLPDSGAARPADPRRRAGRPLADVVGRLQALHARRLPRRVPDGGAVPHRVRHRRRAGRHLQRLRLLRAVLPVRRDRRARGRRRRPQVHAVLRPPGRRAGCRPARRRARRNSIQFGDLDELQAARRRPAGGAAGAGVDEARLYGRDPDDGVGGDGAFFLLSTSPRSTACRRTRSSPPATCRRCGATRR